MNNKTRLLQVALRTDLKAFLRKSFGTLTPGQEYVPAPALGLIADALEKVRHGQIRRLIINMPPRSLKSIAASVAFPAFVLGHDPKQRIICVSYSRDLSKKHSNDFRAVLESPWYRDIFPHTRIGDAKNTESEIELTRRGFRLATSVGGTLTGRGGNIIIIDDPLKPDDAMSESKRTAANLWFNNTLFSRLDDKRTGAIIVVMQRVHQDDLTGFLLDQSDEWKVLSLPAIAEHDEAIPLSNGGIFTRKSGEALFPEREPLWLLEMMKRQIGSEPFSAQYQQAPVPPGGAMIKRDWIRRYKNLPPPSEHIMIEQSWDTASKGGPDNDWSVCTTWLRCQGKRSYLLHVWRQRVDYPTLKTQVIALAEYWKARRILVEDTAAGVAPIQELRSEVSGIVAIKPEGDKQARVSIASAKIQAGEVFFPERSEWLPDLEAELFAFPGSRHDDQCDSISQFLNDQSRSFWLDVTSEQWKHILMQSKIPYVRPPFRERSYDARFREFTPLAPTTPKSPKHP